MKKWLLLVPLLFGLSLFCSGQAVTTLDQNCNVWGAAPATPQCGGSSSAASGTQLFFPDIRGTITNQFEVVVQGTAPGSLTVIVVGCMRGGTCSGTLASSTGTASQILTPSSTNLNVYDKYGVTVTWTGGDATTRFVVNRTGTVAKLSGTGSGTSPTQPAFLVTASPYNAKCDGSTDDTTAIQSAITAASTAHGTVIFPQGICKITSTLTVAAGTTNLGIQGQIGYGSQVAMATAGVDVFDFNGTGGSPINTLTINNMVFSRSVAFTGTPNGLNFSNCQNCNLNYVQVFGSYTNYSTTNGANDIWTYITSGQGSATTVNAGISVNGSTNSLFLEEVLTNGTHTTGLAFTGSAIDTFIYHLSTTGSVSTGFSISGIGASDIHLVEPILDSCPTACINISNSTGGGLGNSNNIEIVDCWCNTGTSGTPNSALISNSEGVHLLGGIYVQRSTSAANSVYFAGGTVRSSIVGAQVINSGGNNVNSGIVVVGKSNTIANNTVSAPTGAGWNNGIYLSTGAANNTISGNNISGFGVAGLTIDSTATGINTYSGNIVDPTNITTPVLDLFAGQVYTGTTLASGVVGDAQGYKSTAAITGPVPVKWDTGNANQVVTTVTTDTGAGVPIGVCVNSPGAAGSCLVMTKGTVALKLGTGTCAIGNFVIVDTTTNGDVKCTGTYSAGTVIGTAQAADSTVGTAFNVALGLR